MPPRPRQGAAAEAAELEPAVETLDIDEVPITDADSRRLYLIYREMGGDKIEGLEELLNKNAARAAGDEDPAEHQEANETE